MEHVDSENPIHKIRANSVNDKSIVSVSFIRIKVANCNLVSNLSLVPVCCSLCSRDGDFECNTGTNLCLLPFVCLAVNGLEFRSYWLSAFSNRYGMCSNIRYKSDLFVVPWQQRIKYSHEEEYEALISRVIKIRLSRRLRLSLH